MVSLLTPYFLQCSRGPLTWRVTFFWQTVWDDFPHEVVVHLSALSPSNRVQFHVQTEQVELAFTVASSCPVIGVTSFCILTFQLEQALVSLPFHLQRKHVKYSQVSHILAHEFGNKHLSCLISVQAVWDAATHLFGKWFPNLSSYATLDFHVGVGEMPQCSLLMTFLSSNYIW